MQIELCPSLKGSPVNNVNTLNILDLILGGDNGSFGRECLQWGGKTLTPPLIHAMNQICRIYANL